MPGVLEGGDVREPLIDSNYKKTNREAMDDEEDPPDAPSGCQQFLSCIKILLIVSLIIYFWLTSAFERSGELSLLMTFEDKGLIPLLPAEAKEDTKDASVKTDAE